MRIQRNHPQLQKSVFCKNNLKYYGVIHSEKSIKPENEKIQQTRDTAAPENKKALQSFPELTNYMKRFIHVYSIKTSFSRIIKGHKDYVRTDTHEKALSHKSCVSYFENHKETLDVSPYEILAIVWQKMRNRED